MLSLHETPSLDNGALRLIRDSNSAILKFRAIVEQPPLAFPVNTSFRRQTSVHALFTQRPSEVLVSQSQLGSSKLFVA